MKPSIYLAIGLLMLIIGAAYNFQSAEQRPEDQLLVPVLTPDIASVVQKGKAIYAEHCAACHGANLEGQSNWRRRTKEGRLPAPPHDESGHTWHHPDSILFEITKYGPAAVINDMSYKSDMPSYEGMLTDEEIIAALSYIKSRWPEHIREHHDMISLERNTP